MRVRYIGHSSISIGVAGRRILVDPWWNGPAFAGQWFQYPPARPEPGEAGRADFVYVSDGHDGHLHVPTLRTIRRSATVLLPRQPESGLRDFIRSLGFQDVRELSDGERSDIAPGICVTAYVLGDESILVVEGDGRTLLHAPRCLHTSPRHVIDHVCDRIRARHPRVDTALIGYRAPGWFPRCVQLTDDVAYDLSSYAQASVESFAYAARRLDASLVLPLIGARTIDDGAMVRAADFDRASPWEELERRSRGRVRTWAFVPGDRVEGDVVIPAGGARPVQRVDAAICGEVASLLAAPTEHADEIELARVEAMLRTNLLNRARRAVTTDRTIECRIDLLDEPHTSFLVEARAGTARISRCDSQRRAAMVLTTRLPLLEAVATHDYGDEIFSFGCGATLQSRRNDLPLYRTLLLLLGRRPLPPRRRDQLFAWLRAPHRRFATWRHGKSWREFHARVQRGHIVATNDPQGLDPERWSPFAADLARAAAGPDHGTAIGASAS
jgi:hypothetical protein